MFFFQSGELNTTLLEAIGQLENIDLRHEERSDRLVITHRHSAGVMQVDHLEMLLASSQQRPLSVKLALMEFVDTKTFAAVSS